MDADEDKLLRAAALENARSILQAKQRAAEALALKSEQLEQSLSMMRATLESTTDGILVTNAGGEVTDFNENFLRMSQMPRELVASQHHQNIQKVIGPQLKVPEDYLAKIQVIYETSPSESYDVLEFTDGRVFERYSRIQRIEARMVGRVWSFRDITQRRQSEEQLRVQNEWFSVTLASIGDAVITVGTDCRVTFLNAPAAVLTGWSCVEAVGKPIDEVMHLIHQQSRAPAINPVAQVLAEGITIELAKHTLLVRRDGSELPIEDSAAPIRNSAGHILGAVMVFHDVSARRREEEKAEQANRAKDLFLAALSHELRTPLTPVLAILSDYRHDNMPRKLAADLETIRRNVELEARLIDDLLDLTRITSGKLVLHRTRVSVAQLINDAIGTCEADLAARKLSLVRECDPSTQTIFADAARLTQILWNLVKNAIKFTPDGGTITVRSWLTTMDDLERLNIAVEDTGKGIELGRLESVFDAFEQGDRSVTRQFGGLGLGLAISSAIARLHHGTLSAMSAGEGCGSTFTLSLPLDTSGDSGPIVIESASEETPVAVLATAANAVPQAARILLVEDHVDTANVFARLLRNAGHCVVHAGTISAALETAERLMSSTGLDLIISDLGLPDGSGLTLMSELSAKYGLRGIAVSGYGMDSDVQQSKAAGFSHHLTKPLDMGLVHAALAKVLSAEH